MTGRWLERNHFPGCQQEPPPGRLFAPAIGWMATRRDGPRPPPDRPGVKITRQDFRHGSGRYRPAGPRSSACPAERAWSGGQPEVPVVGGKGRSNVAGPTQPLKLGRDFGVFEVQVVATIAADELEQPAHAIWAAVAWAKGQAPQYRHQAVAQLPRWDYRGDRVVSAWLPTLVIAPPPTATTVCVVSRVTAVRDVRV